MMPGTIGTSMPCLRASSTKRKYASGLKKYWVIAPFAPAFTLAMKFFRSGLRVTGLRMDFRIARDFDMKMSIAFAADEFHQFAGVAEVPVTGHARRQIAAQRDDAFATHRLVLIEQRENFCARATHARQVRRRIETVFLAQMAHGFGRVAQRRAAGAEGHADIFRLQRLELWQRGFEHRALFVGLGWEKFEGNGDHACTPMLCRAEKKAESLDSSSLVVAAHAATQIEAE